MGSRRRMKQIIDPHKMVEKVFDGHVPSSPEELIDGIQEYSNQTGFSGRIYGYNVHPQKKDHIILFTILGVILLCLLLAFLGGLQVHGIV
jgi:hypothetical protein